MTEARRPPKRTALIGTPLGSSHSGAMAGSWAAGAVKRALGWAAGVPDSGVQSLPFQSIRCAGGVFGHALPPDVAVVGERGVGEDAVAVEGEDGVRVGVLVGAGRHAEEAGLGVDGVEAAVGAELHPADVVTHRLDLPALDGRDEHGQVGLAAGGGEGAGDVAGLALGGGELEDEHVLGHPAGVAGHDRRDAQREALLAEQSVAAVAGAERSDLAGLGEVDDVLVLGVARPGHVGLAGFERSADRVQAGDELAVLAQHLQGAGPHAGHDAHGHGDVGRVRQLHADVGDVGAERAHGEGHHVHGAPLHAAGEEAVEEAAHLVGVTPVVGRAGVDLLLGADEGAVLDPGHVAGVRVGPVTVGPLGVGQLGERAGVDQGLAQAVVLVGGAVAPLDAVGGGQGGHLVDPSQEFRVLRGRHIGGISSFVGRFRWGPMLGMCRGIPQTSGHTAARPRGRVAPVYSGRRSETESRPSACATTPLCWRFPAGGRWSSRWTASSRGSTSTCRCASPPMWAGRR